MKFVCLLSNAPAISKKVAKAEIFDDYLSTKSVGYPTNNIFFMLFGDKRFKLRQRPFKMPFIG